MKKNIITFIVSLAAFATMAQAQSTPCLPKTQTVYDTMCPGGSYNFGGKELRRAGQYVDTITVGACDSIVTLRLAVEQGTNNTVTACDSYRFGRATLTTSGVYLKPNTTSTRGCSVYDTLHLTIRNTNHSYTERSACDSMRFWGDSLYNESGLYVRVTLASGCVDRDTLRLTLFQSSHGSSRVTACESYAWNGAVLSSTDDYVRLYSNEYGCLSTDTLHLTINHGTHNSNTLTACDSYTWNDSNYTASISTVRHYTAANGCASADTLHLTVIHGSQRDTSSAHCENVLWHGYRFTHSVDTTVRLGFTADGCDSLVNLHVVIGHHSTAEYDTTVCDSLVWRGRVYTASGLYSQRFMANSENCDSTDVIRVTVMHGGRGHFYLIANEPYQYGDSTYTESGDYDYHTVNAMGCDSVVTIHLLIIDTTHAWGEDTTVVHWVPTVQLLNYNNRMLVVNHYADGGEKVDFFGYRWYKDGALIAGQDKDYYIPADGEPLSGCYYVEVALNSVKGDWMASDTMCFAASKSLLGEPVLTLWPNPVREGSELTLTLDDNATQADVCIFDANGRLCRKFTAVQGSQTVRMDLPAGVYMVRMATAGHKNVVKKIVVY